MASNSRHVLIIGGGAAGFFTAINIAEQHPDYRVTLVEKTHKVLSKVKISGGGRCNVTNGRSLPSELTPFYPRGHKKLHPVFRQFTTSDMVDWLHRHGVTTHMEEDQRIFPATNNSQTIIDCFEKCVAELGIRLITNCAVTGLAREAHSWIINSSQGKFQADQVVCCTGSTPAVWKTFQEIGLKIVPPLPSLFTFNIKDPRIEGLMGVSFPHVEARIINSKLQESGPLLITHWGLSGPAILKLSAWGARELAACEYRFDIMINYLPDHSSEQAKALLSLWRTEHPKRKVLNYPLGDLPKRFWEQLCLYCEINAEDTFAELPKKKANKLLEELTQGRYAVRGKSTFKEEFVTAGGVDLTEVDLQTFECRNYPGLFLAGEVLDIDGLTGGFNFQACWSAGWIVSQHISHLNSN